MKAAAPGLAALLAQLPVPGPVRRSLRQRLVQPGRHYHGAAHVALLWRRHRRFGAGTFLMRQPWDRMIACAIAFHDAVYDPRRADNEERSALLWRRHAGRMAAPQRRWVEATIRATADHLGTGALCGTRGPARVARAWLLDLDLTPLGERSSEFARNARRLRREFAHLSEPVWDAARLAFLRGIAARPSMLRTRVLAARFGSRARGNITHALQVAGNAGGPVLPV